MKENNFSREHEDLSNKIGITPLGIRSNLIYNERPRDLLFSLSRYKFAAKMLSGKQRVLEIGCGDAFCSPLMIAEVDQLYLVDNDPIAVSDVTNRMSGAWKFNVFYHDMLTKPFTEHGPFDAAYSIDVIEHIQPNDEDAFLTNVCSSLTKNGVFLCGAPSLESQKYASELSKKWHVNCKSAEESKKTMSKYFNNVFLFSMNDEVVHTGFHPMAQYVFTMGVGKRDAA